VALEVIDYLFVELTSDRYLFVIGVVNACGGRSENCSLEDSLAICFMKRCLNDSISKAGPLYCAIDVSGLTYDSSELEDLWLIWGRIDGGDGS
jgi:hypothetical protein